ncbi:multiple sugar transport system substrate-binding protein [Tamaricihabitans halophyticus]|uniref:Multiple sugar transport system substrate-binding protein n=1 Tax=Tamaricihabitans halophyticus TaxID=1262583 RepID=A0A4R2R3K7_9PSEU|nr:ABC transporter substrate-binding protein [Tamaricihabitans halophyticus]TCP56208.1 multiple sugar transport system substrate-binding protein [Tamaricihabitans halophyticus]
MGSTRRVGRGAGSRSRPLVTLGVALVATSVLAACGSETGKTINVYYAPEENFQTVVDNCNEQANGRYQIVYNKLPRDADGQREQMVRRLAAEDDEMDVLGLDVTWVAEFAEAGWAAEWTGKNKAEAEEGVLPGPLETAMWQDKLYAATKNTNIQLMWYDERLTPEPPETWDEVIAAAKRLKQQGKPYQVVFTGAQYEGLVSMYNSITESAGGQILSDDGLSVEMDEGAVRALEILHELTTAGITAPGLTNAQEDETRLSFEAKGSQAAFQLNWPFVYPAMQEGNPERAEHMKWTRFPEATAGEPSRSTIGGYNLAVSSYSKHQPEAFEAALCLRSAENQKFSAVSDGVPPTIESVYNDPEPIDPSKPAGDDNPNMETAYPMKDTILDALKEPGVRPLTPAYQNVSTVISTVLSPPSSIDPQATAERLRSEITDALESKGVLP